MSLYVHTLYKEKNKNRMEKKWYFSIGNLPFSHQIANFLSVLVSSFFSISLNERFQIEKKEKKKEYSA